tara:strand:+ start:412 stop:744 length:333 start_codon:yes stop_codon:yes gene_type:complete
MSKLLNYKQRANEPEWFNKNEDHFYHAVTSGSSPFNEWYEFESEEDALKFALTFESQSVIDHFSLVTVEGKERWYRNDNENGDNVGCVPISAYENRPASFAELAQAESRF